MVAKLKYIFIIILMGFGKYAMGQRVGYAVERHVVDVGIGYGYASIEGELVGGLAIPVRWLIYTIQTGYSKVKLPSEVIGTLGVDYNMHSRVEEVENDRYYWDYFSNGQSRCRDSQTGRFVNSDLCSGWFYRNEDTVVPNVNLMVGVPFRKVNRKDGSGDEGGIALEKLDKQQLSVLFVGVGMQYRQRLRPYMSLMLPLLDFRDYVYDYHEFGLNLWGEVGDSYAMISLGLNISF